jgi:hypothetical protein
MNDWVKSSTIVSLQPSVAHAIAGALTVRMRTYLSWQHLRAAARFAREVRRLEGEHTGGAPNDELFIEHRSRVIAVVLSSTAFLEATINELFADLAEGSTDHWSQLPEETSSVMAEMWRRGVPRTARYPILEKYDIALALARKPPLSRGEQPYQDADALIAIRNALVHYEPSWEVATHQPAEGERHKFEKRLSGRFHRNPLTGEGNPFWPDKCLSYGCCDWAVRTALALADECSRRLGIEPPYVKHRSDFGTR